MAYIDTDYYKNVYQGVDVGDDVLLERLIVRASRDIDMLTRFQIQDITTLHQTIQGHIKTATAMQVEHLNEYGEMASATSSGSGGFRIGSYSEDGGGTSDAWSGRYPSSVLDVLFQTGLLYRGVAAYTGTPWAGDCIG